MVPLLILIILVLLFGVWGAIELALWVLLIAVLVAAVAAYVGRSVFAGSRRGTP